MKLYQVIRSTPLGDLTMGLYSVQEEAQKHLNAYNSEIIFALDLAWIMPLKVSKKYVAKKKAQ